MRFHSTPQAGGPEQNCTETSAESCDFLAQISGRSDPGETVSTQTIRGRSVARIESRPLPDPGNTPGGDRLREIRACRTGCGPADSIRGPPAESLTQTRSPHAESTR